MSKKQKSFIELVKSGKDLKESLRLTRELRSKLNLDILNRRIPELVKIANRLGEASTEYEMDSYPLKSELGKVSLIGSEWSKGADRVSPRVVVGLMLAWLFRSNDNGFSRVFPNGLFLENGVLSRMSELGLVVPQSAKSGLNQEFRFNTEHPFFSRVSKDKALLAVECSLSK